MAAEGSRLLAARSAAADSSAITVEDARTIDYDEPLQRRGVRWGRAAGVAFVVAGVAALGVAATRGAREAGNLRPAELSEALRSAEGALTGDSISMMKRTHLSINAIKVRCR